MSASVPWGMPSVGAHGPTMQADTASADPRTHLQWFHFPLYYGIAPRSILLHVIPFEPFIFIAALLGRFITAPERNAVKVDFDIITPYVHRPLVESAYAGP